MEQGINCGTIDYIDIPTPAKGNLFYREINCEFNAPLIDLRGDTRQNNWLPGRRPVDQPPLCYIFDEDLGDYEHPDGFPYDYAQGHVISLCEQQDGSWHWNWVFEYYMVTAEGSLQLN
jgi:hypothetical protein